MPFYSLGDDIMIEDSILLGDMYGRFGVLCSSDIFVLFGPSRGIASLALGLVAVL